MTLRYKTEKDKTREATKNGNNLWRPISAIARWILDILHNILDDLSDSDSTV